MSKQVLIAHAEGEEHLAEQLAVPIREAGYDVSHRGTVLVGESFNEEASKALNAGGPVVLCGTVKALGTGWAHHLINAARRHQGIRIFAVQMEKDSYIQQLSLDSAISLYWQDPVQAVKDLIAALEKYYPLQQESGALSINHDVEKRYRELALRSYDIIDLANLPEDDRHMATKQLEIRRLYVALRVLVEAPTETDTDEGVVEAIEKRRQEIRRSPWAIKATDEEDDSNRIPVGHRLAKAKRLVILGDPGSGKTTLLRWIATAYLLRLNQDTDWKGLPDVATLPDEEWLPIMIRCRDLDTSCLNGSLEILLRHTLLKAEIEEAEITSVRTLLIDRLKRGLALLLIDGLDEVSDISLRIKLSQQLEQIQIAYPDAPILVTSRIVGYREMGYRIRRGFEHVTVADLSKEDKDDFARRWCAITELPERREAATVELREDIHSTDRIERLTGNPMLLTTMALVKRKIGRLPSRRADLYWNALEVLINWRREVDEPINDREAVPQLEYLAYEMCDRGVSQLRKDEIINLLDRMRDEYPQVHAIKEHSSEEFLRLLERRTGILIEAGYVRHNGRPIPTFEFRHLTFQEYLAGLALVDGRFPNRDRTRSLAANIAPLAAKMEDGEYSTQRLQTDKEVVVTENWREAIRLCVGSCNDDDVDNTLLSILHPLDTEDASITSRPRTVLAALCLADEPNASDGVVREILETLIIHTKADDDSPGMGIYTAAKELSISRWGKLLSDLLIQEFFRLDADTRASVGNIYGSVATSKILQNEILIHDWLATQVSLLSSTEDNDRVCAALGLAYLAFMEKAYILPGMTEGLQSLLRSSAPLTHAAADALRWLNHELLENRAWHPSKFELDNFTALISEPASDPRAVQNLIIIIGREHHVDALKILLIHLKGEKSYVRAAAAKALGEIKAVQAIDFLISALADESSAVRAAAASALGDIADPMAIQPLISLLDDEDVGVQAEASEALGEIGDLSSLDRLITKLEQGEVDVRIAAARALGNLKDVNAVEPLIASLDTTAIDEYAFLLKLSTATALSQIGGERAVEALVNNLDNKDYLHRTAAANALAEYLSRNDEELVINAIKAKLYEGDHKARLSLVNALNDISHSSVTELLISELTDESPAVREAAREALGSKAVGEFFSNNVERSAELFRFAMSAEVSSEPSNDMRNNFAYVLILLKQYEEAAEQFAAMNYSIRDIGWPLYTHNQGVEAYFSGEIDAAKVRLREALAWIRDAGISYDPRNIFCMLVIDGDLATSNRGLPVDAAILLNLYKMGDLKEEELRTELTSRYPKEFEEWLQKFL